MRILIAAVLVLSMSLCLAQITQFTPPTGYVYLPKELTREIHVEAQFKQDGAVLICNFQAHLRESGEYYVAFGSITKKKTAYVRGYYSYTKIEGEAGEVISGTVSAKSPGRARSYMGPNGWEYVKPYWIVGGYKDWKDIPVGDYFRD